MLMFNSFRRVLAFFIGILLTLFSPHYAEEYKHNEHHKAYNTVEIVENAFYNNELEDLEEIMCQNIKDNTENLTEELQKLIDLIDGKRKMINWDGIGYDHRTYDDKNGGRIEQNIYVVSISTFEHDYLIQFLNESINTKNPEEMGIRQIIVYELFSKDWKDVTTLGTIEATERVHFIDI